MTALSLILLGFLGIAVFVGICYGLMKVVEWLWRRW